MKANEVALNSFLSQTKTQFIIPVYQRNYDRTEDQWKFCKPANLKLLQKKQKISNLTYIVFNCFSN